MPEIIKLLLVEDDPHFAEIIRVFLSKRKTPAIDVEHVGSLAAAQKRLNIGTDVVLLDLSLPDSRGLDTFYKVHSQAPGVPINILGRSFSGIPFPESDTVHVM